MSGCRASATACIRTAIRARRRCWPRWTLGRGGGALFAAAAELTGQRPNIDVALVALERTLHLPEGSALAIFAAGRTAGWIAHALEQRQDGRLIRPRAIYAGPVTPA